MRQLLAGGSVGWGKRRPGDEVKLEKAGGWGEVREVRGILDNIRMCCLKGHHPRN